MVKELRVGNLVELPSFNGTGENIVADLSYHVFSITSSQIRDAEYYGKDWAGRAIPLTEDWLLKKMKFKEVKPKAGIQKAFLYNGIRIEMSNSGNFYYKGVSKNKVHLIQNLVYALTNTELTINL